MNRPYYSERITGTSSTGRHDRAELNHLLKSYLVNLVAKGHLQDSFGYHCVDDGFIPGSQHMDLRSAIALRFKNPRLWPCPESIESWTEDELFDVIEFFFDHVATPLDAKYHDWDRCGWHATAFDRVEGKEEFRNRINEMLNSYDDGFSLSESGEIVAILNPGLSELALTPVPSMNADIVDRVHSAINKFQHHRASTEAQKDAVRDLFDVLEYLRPKAKEVLNNKDESDLFQIANNFGIRHHTPTQKTDYDESIWYPWMFQYCLATIHAILRMLPPERRSGGTP
ncbi:MAG: hypothetical protein U0929_07095 [Planctomycetaceae bacterium]